MNKLIIEKAKQFLIKYLKNKKIKGDIIHPWRADGIFLIQHSLRVEGYIRKIIKNEKINKKDEIILRVAGILQDIGSIDDRKNHPCKSVEITYKWLNENGKFGLPIKEIEKLLFLIKDHSNKGKRTDDILSNIIKDADILDEIGVMSIFLASNRVDKNSSFFFEQLLKRINEFEIPFCDQKLKLIYTNTAKDILLKKKNFIKLFSKQLQNELYGSISELDIYSIK